MSRHSTFSAMSATADRVIRDACEHNPAIVAVPLQRNSNVLSHLMDFKELKQCYEKVENEMLLADSKKVQELRMKEVYRLEEFNRKWAAACTIQRAFKFYKYVKKEMMNTAALTARQKRLRAGAKEWQRQMAALTIQFHWRRFYRAKLLAVVAERRARVITVADPAVRRVKQADLVKAIYGTPSVLKRRSGGGSGCRRSQPSLVKECPPAKPAHLARPFVLEPPQLPSVNSFHHAVIQYQKPPRPSQKAPAMNLLRTLIKGLDNNNSKANEDVMVKQRSTGVQVDSGFDKLPAINPRNDTSRRSSILSMSQM